MIGIVRENECKKLIPKLNDRSLCHVISFYHSVQCYSSMAPISHNYIPGGGTYAKPGAIGAWAECGDSNTTYEKLTANSAGFCVRA